MMTAMSDPADRDLSGLFARAKAGDESAWEEIFHQCYPKVIRVVRRKLDRPMRSLYDSTDFASDVMKSLAANVGRLDFPSFRSLMTFLEQVAEQKVIDEYRKAHTLKRDISRRRPLTTDPGGDGHALSGRSAVPTPSQFAQATEAHERIVAGQSEPEQRAAIALKEQGFSLPEIAEQTGWALRDVQRFFKRLRERYMKTSDAR